MVFRIGAGHNTLCVTQFQIEGGGVVQGVTKFILIFFWLSGPKNKIMPIKFTKNGVDSSFSGSEKFFKKR